MTDTNVTENQELKSGAQASNGVQPSHIAFTTADIEQIMARVTSLPYNLAKPIIDLMQKSAVGVNFDQNKEVKPTQNDNTDKV